MNTNFETKLITAPCRDCREPFDTKVLFINGVEKIRAAVCPACSVKLEQEQRAQEAVARDAALSLDQQQREARWAKLCPLEFRLPTESGGNTDLARMDAVQPRWRKLLEWRYCQRGLILRGSTGTCKTRAVWRLLRRLWEEGKSIQALTAAQFDRQCRDAGGKFTLSEWFDRLARMDALFIDDLGKAQWTPATEAQFFDLVDQRTREGKPMLVTTNDDKDSLTARLSDDRAEPLVRRLCDYCEGILF
jgi:DNA replication protein DnaC